MIEERRSKNSQYITQIAEVTVNEKADLVPEQGALIICEDILYIGDGEQFKQLYPSTAEGAGMGWGKYDDVAYNINRPYDFTTAEFKIPNSATLIEEHGVSNLYDGNKILPEAINNVYTLTICFKAHLNTANGHAQVNLTARGTTMYNTFSDVITFPKGNGVEHVFSKSFQFYADANAVNNGIEIKFKSSHSGSMYDISYFIQKNQSY